MGDQRREDRDEPSLELPSLFRRRRREVREDTADPEPAVRDPEPSAAEQLVAEQDEATRPLYVEDAHLPVTEPDLAEDPVEVWTAEAHEEEHDEVSRTRGLAVPTIPAVVAVALTGLVVGLAGTALTFGGLEGCRVVRGTSSCGGSGLLLLVAIVAVMALIGAALLGTLGVPEARSTSALGVGIICVVAMVALLDVVFSGAMFLAVPVLGAVAYLLAHWVTTRVAVELDDGRRSYR